MHKVGGDLIECLLSWSRISSWRVLSKTVHCQDSTSTNVTSLLHPFSIIHLLDVSVKSPHLLSHQHTFYREQEHLFPRLIINGWSMDCL